MADLKVLQSIDALMYQLENEKIQFHRVQDEPIIGISTRLGDQEGLLYIRWEPVPGVIQFIQILPLIVPKDQIKAIVVLLNRINFNLPILGFSLNEEKGILTFRTQAYLDANHSISSGVVGTFIRLASSTAEKFLPQFQAIIAS